MRLSEAMLLGSLMVRPARGILLVRWFDGDRGCALGMACKAIGAEIPTTTGVSLDPIYEEWPWTLKFVNVDASSDCRCRGSRFPLSLSMNAALFIAHIFDEHIAAEHPLAPVWTLEQLISWVRVHEPEETEGQQLIDGQLAESSHVDAILGKK